MHRLNCLLLFWPMFWRKCAKCIYRFTFIDLVNAYFHAPIFQSHFVVDFIATHFSYSRRNLHVIFWINNIEMKHQSMVANLVHRISKTIFLNVVFQIDLNVLRRRAMGIIRMLFIGFCVILQKGFTLEMLFN